MADQPKFRAGQRVRVTAEGTLVEDGYRQGGLDLDIGNGSINGFSGVSSLLRYLDGFTIEVLAEPRPAEPQGLGAVVQDGNGALWVRVLQGADVTVPWRSHDHYYVTWSEIPDPITVLSDGWVE